MGSRFQLYLEPMLSPVVEKKNISETTLPEYQGRSYVYAKFFSVHIWTKHMGRFYHNSDGLLMVIVQNVCVEPI